MPKSIISKRRIVKILSLQPIRKKLLKPAARWYLNERQIEAAYAAAVGMQQSPVRYRDMIICNGLYDSIPDDV